MSQFGALATAALADAALLGADLTLTPRLATAMFYAMGVEGLNTSERRGIVRLAYLTVRLGSVPENILAPCTSPCVEVPSSPTDTLRNQDHSF